MFNVIFNERLQCGRPFFHPFQFRACSHSSDDPFPLRGSYFVGANTLCQPHSSANRYFLRNTLIKERFSTDTVRYCSTKTSQRNLGTRQVSQPCLTFRIRKSNSWRWLESRRQLHPPSSLLLLEDGSEQKPEGLKSTCVLEMG